MKKLVKTIKWKVERGEPSQISGYVNGEVAFHIGGSLCVTDIRASRACTGNGDDYISPSHYKTGSQQRGKEIAHDLLNGLNIEEHEANKQEWLNKQEQSLKVIQDAQKFLDDLEKMDKTQTKLDL